MEKAPKIIYRPFIIVIIKAHHFNLLFVLLKSFEKAFPLESSDVLPPIEPSPGPIPIVNAVIHHSPIGFIGNFTHSPRRHTLQRLFVWAWRWVAGDGTIRARLSQAFDGLTMKNYWVNQVDWINMRWDNKKRWWWRRQGDGGREGKMESNRFLHFINNNFHSKSNFVYL